MPLPFREMGTYLLILVKHAKQDGIIVGGKLNIFNKLILSSETTQ
jgi:hypothetical protein